MDTRTHKDPATERFLAAAAGSFPVFAPNERESTPQNSTPYVIGIDSFKRIASTWTGREHLVGKLVAALNEATHAGIAVDFALIGGSFTVLTNSAPRDLDAVCLYRVADENLFDAGRLKVLQSAWKRLGLDARLVPCDGDPLVLIKTISYFSVLYSKKTGDMVVKQGLVLVDCRDKGT